MSLQSNKTTLGSIAFARCGHPNQMLCRLSADAPLTDALEHASNLISCATRMSLLATHGDGAEDCAMAAHYLSEMSKAVIDYVTTALLKPEAGHVQ